MSDDEKVGYKRPPKAHRFKSGNKAAAKTKQEQLTQEEQLPNLLKTVNAPVKVRGKDGSTSEMDAFEAQLRKQFRMAVSDSDLKAIRYLLGLIIKFKIHSPPVSTKMYGVLVVPGRLTKESWERLFSKKEGSDDGKE